MSRKGENIFLRKDGRWEARYIKERKMDGRYRYGYVYGKNYLEVKNKRNEILLNLEQVKKKHESCKYKFNYYIDNWLNSMKFMVKKSTYAHYYRIVNNHISPDLGEIKVSYLTTEVIENYINKKFEIGRMDRRGGLSNKTVRDIIVVLRQILTYANVHINFKLPKQKKKEIRILNKKEQKKLESEVLKENTSYAIGVLVCLYTGMRLGEICALKWEDINLSKKVIKVKKTIVRIQDVEGEKEARTKIVIDNPKTENSKREIPMNKYLYSILKEYYEPNNGGRYLLTNSYKYIEPRTYYNRYKTIVERAEIGNYGFHALRHTFATRCIEIGMDPKTLSEILGHSDVKVTLSLYVHPSNKMKDRYMERLNPTTM